MRLREAITTLAFAVFIAGCGQDSNSVDPSPPDPNDIESFARNELGISNYRFARADLNEDGYSELLFYANDRYSCGSGGCHLFVVEREKIGFRVVSIIPISHLPVRILPTLHHGWHDLAVTVYGGGIVEPYVAQLPFDGVRYAENPSRPPATKITENLGEVLIVENPGDYPDL